MLKMSPLFGSIALAGMFASPSVSAFELAQHSIVATGSWADAVAIGDVNGDGLNDVVLTTVYYSDPDNDGKVFIFLGEQGGTLADPIKIGYGGYASRTGIALITRGGSNEKQIVVGHGSNLTLLSHDGQNGFTSTSVSAPRDVSYLAALDVDLDGHEDVVGLSWSSGATIFIADGQGGIASQQYLATNASGYNDVAVGDFNADGIRDLAVMSGQSYATPNISVHLHDGSAGLQAARTYFVGVNELTDGIAVGDLNGDGRDDISVSHSSASPSTVSVLYQDTSGQLGAPQPYPTASTPTAMATADLDGNGLTDLAVLHGSGTGVGVYLQDEFGLGFESVAPMPYATWYNAEGIAIGDINADGCADAAVADYNHGLVLLHGTACVPPLPPTADLAVSIGGGSAEVTVRVSHLGGKAAISDGVARVSLRPNKNSVRLIGIPSACVAINGHSWDFDCLINDLSATEHHDLTFRLRGNRASVDVVAEVASSIDDPDASNNRDAQRVAL